MNEKVLVLDCGGYTIKTKYALQDTSIRIIPNSIVKAKNERRRVFIGDQLSECTDFSGLYFTLPYEKGFLINFDVQHQIWDYVFSKECMDTTVKDTTLILTQPHFTFQTTLEAINEAIFEDHLFKSFYRTTPSLLSNYHLCQLKPGALCTLVLDSGFSFTHVAPFCKGKLIEEAVLRISVGGKILTNHLKDIISYRQLNVMEETYVMNQCKEDACFVSQDFQMDMSKAKLKNAENPLLVEYVLPDYHNVTRGFTRSLTHQSNQSEQCIRLNNERFTVPELLFHPSDVNIPQMGVAEAVVHSINKCPKLLQPHLYSNIVLTGGNCLFPGFKERFVKDIRSLAPDFYEVNVFLHDKPVEFACSGADFLVQSDDFNQMIVTKQEYNEFGHNICLSKFSS